VTTSARRRPPTLPGNGQNFVVIHSDAVIALLNDSQQSPSWWHKRSALRRHSERPRSPLGPDTVHPTGVGHPTAGPLGGNFHRPARPGSLSGRGPGWLLTKAPVAPFPLSTTALPVADASRPAGERTRELHAPADQIRPLRGINGLNFGLPA
jgi:hypothetical protein